MVVAQSIQKVNEHEKTLNHDPDPAIYAPTSPALKQRSTLTAIRISCRHPVASASCRTAIPDVSARPGGSSLSSVQLSPLQSFISHFEMVDSPILHALGMI